VDRRTFLAALAALPGAALLPGCDRGRRRGARTLRIAYRTDFKSLDPAECFDAATLSLMRLLYNGLLDCDDDMRLVPWLAADMPAVSDDKKTYTFRVREGVHFGNGRELTAEDFVWSLERVLDPATTAPGAGFLRGIRGAKAFQKAREKGAGPETRVEGLRAPDRYTFQVELAEPDLAFPWLMSMPFSYPVPREWVEQHGEEFYRNPCGTGPLTLAEWQRDKFLRFERKPRHDGPARPGYDALEIFLGADDFTQMLMFERGELDLLMPIPQPDLVRITHDPRWRPNAHLIDLQATDFLVMNCEVEPFDRKEVRQAVCHAVNREHVLRALNGAGIPANGMLPPGVFGHDEGRKGYEFDPEKAKALLARAGYDASRKVELWYFPDNVRWEKIASVVQQDLRNVGMNVELKRVAFLVFIDSTARRRNVAFSLSGWTEDYPDASDFLGTLCDGTKRPDEQSNNPSFYNNDRVNDLLHDAATAADADKRLAVYRKAEDLIMDDAPYCVLAHPKWSVVHQPRVKSSKSCMLHPVWYVRWEDLSLEQP
jgi:peptide/nickel transport system substrate-binding protein